MVVLWWHGEGAPEVIVHYGGGGMRDGDGGVMMIMVITADNNIGYMVIVL